MRFSTGFRRTTVSLLALPVLLGACGTGTAATAGGAVTNPCSLLTAADVRNLTVGLNPTTASRQGSTCNYSPDLSTDLSAETAIGYVRVTVIAASSFDVARHDTADTSWTGNSDGTGPSVPLSSIHGATSAFWSDGPATPDDANVVPDRIYVRSGAVYFYVEVLVSNGWDGNAESALVGAANQALSNLIH